MNVGLAALVGVGVTVAVGIAVRVQVALGVAVKVRVGAGIIDGVQVGLGTAVRVHVGVGIAVNVQVAGTVAVDVRVAVDMDVAVRVGALEAVGVRVGALVGVGVSVDSVAAVDVAGLVAVLVACAVAVMVAVLVAVAAATVAVGWEVCVGDRVVVRLGEAAVCVGDAVAVLARLRPLLELDVTVAVVPSTDVGEAAVAVIAAVGVGGRVPWFPFLLLGEAELELVPVTDPVVVWGVTWTWTVEAADTEPSLVNGEKTNKVMMMRIAAHRPILERRTNENMPLPSPVAAGNRAWHGHDHPISAARPSVSSVRCGPSALRPRLATGLPFSVG